MATLSFLEVSAKVMAIGLDSVSAKVQSYTAMETKDTLIRIELHLALLKRKKAKVQQMLVHKWKGEWRDKAQEIQLELKMAVIQPRDNELNELVLPERDRVEEVMILLRENEEKVDLSMDLQVKVSV